MSRLAFALALVSLFFVARGSAFVPAAKGTCLNSPTRSQQYPERRAQRSSLNIFGNLKGAFANDDSLGKADNAGLKGGPNFSQTTINGKPVKAVANQKVSQVAAAARVKITYSCKKGDCGTCEVMMNGRIVKACQAKITSGKCDINTL
eukprot:CAMPEP_0178523130 /NCGR_PEP_ID=MMETSP0696-20121128/28917_1 /TAXON_ID=265572 /ORGANISM="Extubocellulus spinifer, Strain CCMP396" /LENGTH=147 /DNA_ID=CAMNT_0020154321 /DNA_START=56 /DNA_END=499 /DNA_ORIENTATION=+